MITRIYPVDLCKVSATMVEVREDEVILFVEMFWGGRDPFIVFDDFTEALRFQQQLRAGIRGDVAGYNAYSINDHKFENIEDGVSVTVVKKKIGGIRGLLLKLLGWRGYK